VKIFWNDIKQHRGSYIVEYSPPPFNSPFANISITILEKKEIVEICRIIEGETEKWMARYPVPVMTSAFDDTGSLISLKQIKPCSSLVGHFDPASNNPITTWRLIPIEELHPQRIAIHTLMAIYADVPFRTEDDVQKASEANAVVARQAKLLGLSIALVWLVIIPLSIEILGFASPVLGVAILVFSLIKGFITVLKLLGKLPESEHSKKIKEEELQMRHHHNHCKRNPEGFSRLLVENLNEDSRKRTATESNALLKRSSN